MINSFILAFLSILTANFCFAQNLQIEDESKSNEIYYALPIDVSSKSRDDEACVFPNSLNRLLSSSDTSKLCSFNFNEDGQSLVEILMKYGDDATDPVLNRAMRAKDYDAVALLISYGVNINSRSGVVPFQVNDATIDSILYYQTVLEMAIASGELSMVEHFLSNKADPLTRLTFHLTPKNSPTTKSVFVRTAVYDAIFSTNSLDILELFAQHGFDLSQVCYEYSTNSHWHYKYTPIQLAIASNKPEVIQFLLSIGVKF